MIINLYNGTVKIEFIESNHSYWLLENGKRKRLTGTTTYCGVLNKPFLIPWAVNTTIDYVRDHIELLQNGAISGDSILEMARQESDRLKEESADLGKAIHKWVEDYIMGRKPEMPDDDRIMLGVNSFLEWVDDHKVKFLWAEKVCYSRQYGYVGTADIGIEIKKKMYLVDIKTGNAIYPEVKLQTSAYAKAIEEEKGKPFAGRWAVRLSKETEDEYYQRLEKKGLKKIPPFKIFEAIMLDENPDEMHSDFKNFLHAMDLVNWQKEATKFLAKT